MIKINKNSLKENRKEDILTKAFDDVMYIHMNTFYPLEGQNSTYILGTEIGNVFDYFLNEYFNEDGQNLILKGIKEKINF